MASRCTQRKFQLSLVVALGALLCFIMPCVIPALSPTASVKAQNSSQSSSDRQTAGGTLTQQQTGENQYNAEQDTDDQGPDSMRFYAMMDANPALPPRLQSMLLQHPQLNRGHMGFRPALQWYFFSNRPKRFLPSLSLILLFTVVQWSLFEKWLKRAQTSCREKFWSTMLAGILVAGVLCWMIRLSVMTMFFWPMGVFISGVMQFAMIGGLSTVVSLIGDTLAFYLKCDSWPLIGSRPLVKRFTHLLLGALFITLLLQIPGIGILPRIGTRLVGLLAVLGLGGIYRTRRTSSSV